MTATARVAALAACALLLAACGGGTDTAAGDPAAPVAPTGPTDVDAPTDGGQGANVQTAPGAVVAAFFQALADQRFGDACALYAPATQARIAAIGRDCRTELADVLSDAERAAIGTVVADESLVEIAGDTAEVPGDALSSDDGEPDAPEPNFPPVKTTLISGLWWVVSG